jgi:succinate dehydrogenase / fumarate reductase cytochrome b subunit
MAAGGGAGSPTPVERAALKARRKAQPQFRNIRVDEILRYRMAPAAIVSILHRISGVLMFLVGIPFLLYLLQKSLTSELSFETYRAVATSGVGKLVLLVLIWGFFHHLLAGIRFLVLDLHIGTERQTATLTARIVLGLSILFTLISAGFLFGLF